MGKLGWLNRPLAACLIVIVSPVLAGAVVQAFLSKFWGEQSVAFWTIFSFGYFSYYGVRHGVRRIKSLAEALGWMAETAGIVGVGMFLIALSGWYFGTKVGWSNTPNEEYKILLGFLAALGSSHILSEQILAKAAQKEPAN